MSTNRNVRRDFIKQATGAIGGMALFSALPRPVKAFEMADSSPRIKTTLQPEKRIRFAVIGINHGHINSLVDMMLRAGGIFVSFYAKEADLRSDFAKKYSQAAVAGTDREILENKTIQLIISAAIPDERAAIAVAAMKHGKDFLVDKPGVATLSQLAEVRKVQKETGRIFCIFYGRLENRGSLKAGELVKAGAIGKVIQTIALAPHRTNPQTRPEWFWNTKRYGGIINDIGSHQFEEFLFMTGSTNASIVAAQVANVNHPQYPAFEDFGDVTLTGDHGTGYMRLDWFTPAGLKSWGDDRITILGTEGYIELRKNLDIAGREGGQHLFLVDQKET
ncbi:MAG: Gfo/Idh/MocA family oxidoreductase, partial [Sphingobacteriales bacterium]